MPKLAAVPTGSEVSPCCCYPCESVGIANLSVLISGPFTSCGCNDADTTLPVIVSEIDIDGEFEVVYVSPGVWHLAGFGTARVQYYGGVDCSGEPFFDEACDVTIHIFCTGGGGFFVDIYVPGSELPLPGDIRIFEGSGSDFGDAIPNNLTCAFPFAAEGGTVTLALA